MNDINNIYIFEIPKCVAIKNVYSKLRNEEIQNCKSDDAKRQKYVVWKLLEYALKDSFNLTFNSLDFLKDENGKWKIDQCKFSLSHTNNVVAVACSQDNIGVDIEEIKEINRKIKLKILTEKELKEFEEEKDKNKYLLFKWTQKEAIYKSEEVNCFYPNKIETSDFNVFTKEVSVNFSKYVLSVKAENKVKCKINLCQNIDL